MVRKVLKKPVKGRTKAFPQNAAVSLTSKKKMRKGASKNTQKTGRLTARHVPEEKRMKIIIADNTIRRTDTGTRPSRTVSKTPKQSVVVRSNIELALLSPFRFPMVRNDRVIASAARYAGVFFVLVGGFFSLLNLEYASGTVAGFIGVQHQAQVIDGTLQTTNNAIGTSAANPTPDVRVSIEGQGTTLTNMAVVMVNVPDASEVKLLAERQSGGTPIPLGNAFKIDASTWRFYWDTRQYPDDGYRIRTVVRNPYGFYERQDSLWRLVDNVPDTSGETAGGSTANEPAPDTTNQETASVTSPDVPESLMPAPVPDTTSVVAPPATAELPKVTLRVLESAPLSGGVPLEILVTSATDVKVYARNVGTGALYYAGSAMKKDNGTWRLEWDTRKVPDGMYALRAGAVFSETLSVNSSILERSVKNGTPAVPSLGGVTTTPATSTAVATAVPETTTSLTPTIDLRIGASSPVSGFADLFIKTSPAVTVDIFALPKGSLTPRFIGLAQKVSGTNTDWKYVWSTTQSPNGDYELYARVKTEFGFTEGRRVPVRVLNQIVEKFTEEEEESIGALQDANGNLVTITEKAGDPLDDGGTDAGRVPPKVVYVEPVETFMGKVAGEDSEVAETEIEQIESALTEFRKQLNVELNALARAEREDNEDELRRVKENIENLRANVIRELRTSVTKRELLDRIDGYLAEVANELRDITLKNEQILRERIGDAIKKDSDKDGITDYDEVNLHLTNPFSADTDGDGYIDSIEIKLGYSPLSTKNETLVAYESPQEAGIVREDLLTVDAITTLAPAEGESTESGEAEPRAFISGKGLPNSFVTLYIFSTPIVLTVKTDADGSWSYVFDKELEEGEHEVYVGITDNAGRIVAKSAPLPFVKTAIAFTEAEAAAVPVETSPEPSLVDERMLLLVASIAIVGLGLVLILLGLHVRGRQEPGAIVQTA